jgi:hypothetical protein
MDPYLEHPALWTGVHAALMVEIRRQLSPLLRPRYVASVEERVFIETTGRERVPNVWVQRTREDGGRLAVADPSLATPVIIETDTVEVREHFVLILDRYRDLQVVTVIEVLSPANKAPGPRREAYLAKQASVLSSECHLVEIDSLRSGRHTLSVPQESLPAHVGSYDYLICVNRHPLRNRHEAYGWTLRSPMPRFGIPLVAPDHDVKLDLQAAFEQVYEDGSYMLRVRYDEPCQPPLSPEDQAWASQCWASYRSAHSELFS